MCRTVQQDQGGPRCDGFDATGNCPEGKIPGLSPANRAFWRLFEVALPGLIRQDGFDYGALQVTFDAFGVSRHRRPFYMIRAAAAIEVIRRIREKRDGKHPET